MKKSLFVMFYICLLVLFLFLGVIIGRSDRSGFTVLSLHQSTTLTVAESSVNNGNKLDINDATVEDLVDLKGIGNVLAERIVSYRSEHGPFHSIYELLKVEGIGEVKFGEICDYICVGG